MPHAYFSDCNDQMIAINEMIMLATNSCNVWHKTLVIDNHGELELKMFGRENIGKLGIYIAKGNQGKTKILVDRQLTAKVLCYIVASYNSDLYDPISYVSYRLYEISQIKNFSNLFAPSVVK